MTWSCWSRRLSSWQQRPSRTNPNLKTRFFSSGLYCTFKAGHQIKTCLRGDKARLQTGLFEGCRPFYVVLRKWCFYCTVYLNIFLTFVWFVQEWHLSQRARRTGQTSQSRWDWHWWWWGCRGWRTRWLVFGNFGTDDDVGLFVWFSIVAWSSEFVSLQRSS